MIRIIKINNKVLEIKNNYIRMKNEQGLYYRENNVVNNYVDRFSWLLNDHGPTVKWFLEELLDSKSRGITGELTDIDIHNNHVSVGLSDIIGDGAPEDEPIEIDRNELIRIAQEWQELVAKRAPEIFIVHKDGKYFVTNALPEGVD